MLKCLILFKKLFEIFFKLLIKLILKFNHQNYFLIIYLNKILQH